MGIGGIGGPVRIEVLQPSVRSVVQRLPEDGEVVGVHDPMHKPHPHPVHHEGGGAGTDLAEPAPPHGGERACIVGACVDPELRKVPPNGEVHECRQQLQLTPARGELKGAQTDKGWRHPAYNRPGFRAWIAVVEHVANDRLPRPHEREGPGRGDPQMMHGL